MLRERLGKRAAALDGQFQSAENSSERAVAFLFFQQRNPRRSGRAASTSVANCRVNVVKTLGLTLPPKPGILMLMLMLCGLPFLAASGQRAGPLAWTTFFPGLFRFQRFWWGTSPFP